MKFFNIDSEHLIAIVHVRMVRWNHTFRIETQEMAPDSASC
jgi:hypothetical protein